MLKEIRLHLPGPDEGGAKRLPRCPQPGPVPLDRSRIAWINSVGENIVSVVTIVLEQVDLPVWPHYGSINTMIPEGPGSDSSPVQSSGQGIAWINSIGR